PVIDIHSHLTWAAKASKGVPLSSERKFLAPPEELLAVMDRKNIKAMVNLTGGWGEGLREAIEKLDKGHPGRFYTFTEPAWAKINEPDYTKVQAELIQQARQ